MLGLIKKDILMIKNNSKFLILSLIIYVMFAIANEVDISFIIPFMIAMFFISTFSYDEYNNWHAYAITLPNGRNNVVKSKYIATLLLITVATLVSIILSIVMSSIRKTLDIEEILSSCMGSTIAIIFIISLIYPLLFKFGSEKGRIALFIVSFVLVGIVSLSSKITTFSISKNLIIFVENNLPLIFIISIVLMLSISYIISVKIYSKKEY